MLAEKVDLHVAEASEMEEFIDLLHYDTSTKRGNIKLFIKNGEDDKEYKLLTYERLKDRMSSLKGLKDVYISPNSFIGYKGDTGHIWHYRSLYVDLDIIKKTDYGIDEVFEMLMRLAKNGEIPEPTMIVYSGGGLHVYWRIKDAPKQAQKFWQYLEYKLIEKLKPLGADPAASDGARVLRVPETINSKNGLTCSIWHINKSARYTLDEIQDTYFPKEIKPPRAKRATSKKAKGKITRLLSPYSLQIARAKDLYTLVTLRNGNIEKLRNILLLDYCYFKGLTVNTGELQQLALELNNLFYEPLRPKEVSEVIKKASKYMEEHKQDKKKGLNSTNETLISKYGISMAEMEQLETIISKEEKQRRKRLRETPRGADGLTDKQRQLLEQKKKAHELAAQGFTLREISESLNCSLGKIHNLLK